MACRGVEPLDGGICSAVFALGFDCPPHSAVVKLWDNAEDDPLPRERARLDYLHEHVDVPCPDVYLQDSSRKTLPYSFLLLERLPGGEYGVGGDWPRGTRLGEREFAEVLLELHSHKGEAFGGIGEEPGHATWADVFLPDLWEIRGDMEALLPAAILREVDRALGKAEEAMRDQGEPTLIHNDVWAGNIMVHQREDGWHLSGLLDPVGLQFADVEKELAYLEAFDTVGEAFFDVYTRARPLRPGYAFRRLFYWLYTYMLHVWLGFGAEFHERVAETAQHVLTYRE